MALTVQLETEFGKVRETVVTEPAFPLNRLLPKYSDHSYCCWRFIDVYGSTVFNQLQMDTFIYELARLRQQTEQPQDHIILDRIEDFARFCKRHAHHYIRFVGD
ncbi:MAG: hypothetical protein ACTHMR_23120 [Thermomicrobiales bacterium]